MSKIDKCDSCGSYVVFDPEISALKCPKCGKVFSIDDKELVSYKHPITMVGIVEEPVKTGTDSVVKCLACGAQVEGGVAKCPYCGSTAFEQSGELSIKPDGIIPFMFDTDAVSAKFAEGIRTKKFLPNSFKKSPPELKIMPLYIPAFSFDIASNSEYYGVLSDKIKKNSGETLYRDYHINGSKYYETKNMLFESSKYLSQSTLDAIKPFDLSVAKVYDSDFIKGYSVEMMNGTLSSLRDEARLRHERIVRERILMDYHYESVRKLDIQPKYLKSEYSYIILPTYKITYQYKNKSYTAFMNGQTGKVDNGVPKSLAKILSVVFLSIGGVALIILLIYLFASGKLR